MSDELPRRIDLIEKPEPRGPGRPKRIIDKEQIYKLAKLGATFKEMANFFNTSTITLHKHYQDVIEDGWAELALNLRRAQIESALMDKNIQMQIFLGKVLLKQRDNYLEVSTKPELDELSQDQIMERLNEINKLLLDQKVIDDQ